jgi:hypothetical protein
VGSRPGRGHSRATTRPTTTPGPGRAVVSTSVDRSAAGEVAGCGSGATAAGPLSLPGRPRPVGLQLSPHARLVVHVHDRSRPRSTARSWCGRRRSGRAGGQPVGAGGAGALLVVAEVDDRADAVRPQRRPAGPGSGWRGVGAEHRPQRVTWPPAGGRPPRSRMLRQPSQSRCRSVIIVCSTLLGRVGEGRCSAAYRKRQRVAPYGSAVATPNAVCNAKR